MGFSSRGVCYETLDDAFQALWGGYVSATGGNRMQYAFTDGTSWRLWDVTFNAAGVETVNGVLTLQKLPGWFGQCTFVNDPYTNFIDGNLLGWGVVLCMALAWGVVVLRRSL